MSDAATEDSPNPIDCQNCGERKATRTVTNGGEQADLCKECHGKATDQDEDRATVRVWSGDKRYDYDDILETEPDEYDVDIVDDETVYVPHDAHVVLTEAIENHRKYAFAVDAPQPVTLIIHTSDHHHDTIDGFERGDPVEQGLRFAPDDSDRPPFQTELWGAIRFRVDEQAAD